jgi:hypothetical protein|tara:strand:- start:186 stop:434 length:249 start_codon:yes stop_codon:yes gene_type:complete
MMIKDRLTHIIVLVVNILSWRKYHVRIGKVTYERAKIKNLGPQISFISAYASCTPYQKQSPAGKENIIKGRNGRPSHHFHTN